MEEIESLSGRALAAMLRSLCLVLFGCALAWWGLVWMQANHVDARGAGLFLLGVGIWFLWGARWEIPAGLRLRAEAERLRFQYECEVESEKCEEAERQITNHQSLNHQSVREGNEGVVALMILNDGTVRKFYQAGAGGQECPPSLRGVPGAVEPYRRR